MKGSRVYNYPPLKMFFNRIYNNLFAFLFFIPVNDISNAFKAYRRVIIEKVKPKTKGFEITSEIILKAHIKNFKITQIPVDWRGRSEKESKFGLFKSPKFLFFKLPKIGYSYLWLSLKLWFKFISSRFF